MIRIIKYAQSRDTFGQEADEPNFYLFAWCLMDNHVHLLMQPNGFELWEVVKRLTVAYAMHFNNHYDRVGHLFQDRFKSEPVEDLAYFYELLRYIHMNPVKAEICKTPDRYPYSSFRELTGKDADVQLCNAPTHKDLQTYLNSLKTDFTQEGQTLMCKNAVGEEIPIAMGMLREDIEEFLQTMPQQTLMEKITQEGLTLVCKTLNLHLQQETAEESDNAIVRTLLELTGAATITEFQRLDKKTMRGALAIVREAGCSIRRLSRLSGISQGIIRGCKNPLLLLEAQEEKDAQEQLNQE